MKKGLLLVLTSIMLLIIAACGTSGEGTGSDAEGENEGEASKTLRVVTDAAYAPFEYLEGDKVVGFDIDFINAVADEAGIDIKVENVGWDAVLIETEKGTSDLGVSAITINEERKKSYDFTVPYFLSTNKILVNKDSDIKSAKDLEGRVVAVQNATTGQVAIEKIVGENNPDVKKFENTNLAIMELLSGGAEAVVADNTVIEAYVENNPDKDLMVIEDPTNFEAEYYGIMFPKDSEYLEEFNTALKAILENGTYAKIYKEWFGSEPDVQILIDQQ
ncbi:basic amino acid ABC transporter substrate-binding protein [Litchfieldia salsa]|uniref:Polar amino acid transport system substrate-binding protein n=1 Tax=Litchfieldia salsa TaxID=930152 RepID=A0A1H0UZE6_9BACI|nr:basic amino acid ABC transporter substrate-binding protein [Litchfieldia salsa]SDP71484.1 polar amino acid transport system substrate-binding protein [Litchfieldia salsa]